MSKQQQGEAFRKVLDAQPDILVKIDEHEMKGTALFALVETEPDTIGTMIGGNYSVRTVMHMLDAIEDAKIKLLEQFTDIAVAELLKK